MWNDEFCSLNMFRNNQATPFQFIVRFKVCVKIFSCWLWIFCGVVRMCGANIKIIVHTSPASNDFLNVRMPQIRDPLKSGHPQKSNFLVIVKEEERNHGFKLSKLMHQTRPAEFSHWQTTQFSHSKNQKKQKTIFLQLFVCRVFAIVYFFYLFSNLVHGNGFKDIFQYKTLLYILHSSWFFDEKFYAFFLQFWCVARLCVGE